jgi:hypothetical protein
MRTYREQTALILEKVNQHNQHNNAKKKRMKYIYSLSAAAACLVVILSIYALPFIWHGDFDFSNLPMLTISGDNRTAAGFEGILAYDIGEFADNGNPWSEHDKIISLPVFKNTYTDLSGDEMLQKAGETAEIMGWTIDEIHTLPTEEELQRLRDKINSLPEDMRDSVDMYDNKPYMAIAKCGDYTIDISPDGCVSIDFGDDTPGFPLPEKYNFTAFDNTEKQAKEAIQYLLEQFKAFVNMKSPALSFFGDYNIYAQRLCSYAAYEGEGDLIDRIIGYNFDYVRFYPREGENNKLWLMRRYKTDLSAKIGDYPIITVKEARELLLENRFITTVPPDTVRYAGEFIDENYIAAVELVYRNGKYEEIFMPYYKFYIELTGFPALEALNLKNYGVFYVPAVKSEYLTDMPVWDGRFN